jgi:transcriptional regulator with XRE-family HTH domain
MLYNYLNGPDKEVSVRPLEGVRDLRERRMLTQQELADRAGVSLFTVQRIERGAGSVRPKTGRAIAGALGVRVEDLLGKAQAPLPDFEVVAYEQALERGFEQAREERDPYAPWLDFVERYASRWEAKIAAGELDAASLDEWIATTEDLTTVLHSLNAEEVRHVPEEEKLSSFGAPGAKTGVALWRLLDLIEPMIAAGVKVWSGSELERLRRRKAERYPEEHASAAG